VYVCVCVCVRERERERERDRESRRRHPEKGRRGPLVDRKESIRESVSVRVWRMKSWTGTEGWKKIINTQHLSPSSIHPSIIMMHAYIPPHCATSQPPLPPPSLTSYTYQLTSFLPKKNRLKLPVSLFPQ
jgi:hypothetical protein